MTQDLPLAPTGVVATPSFHLPFWFFFLGFVKEQSALRRSLASNTKFKILAGSQATRDKTLWLWTICDQQNRRSKQRRLGGRHHGGINDNEITDTQRHQHPTGFYTAAKCAT